MRRLTIDPVTRIEGHGRIEVFLEDDGSVAEAYFVAPDLRGFERLCIGRPVEEMPGLTSRICGLCPEAHHLASTRVLDRLFGVDPPAAARVIRELLYQSFVTSNHVTHFFALAGPDLLLGPEVPVGQRTLFGVLESLGPDTARRVLAHRTRTHEVIELLGGRRIHPVAGLPGGWSRRVDEATRGRVLAVAEENVAFALECLELYRRRVLERSDLDSLLRAPGFTHRLHSMGSVDDDLQLDLYDGRIRVVDPDGGEVARFDADRYRDHLAERVEPWTYLKMPYLSSFGWRGLSDGGGSGLYAVGPLARMNACRRLSTPLADRERQVLFETFGATTDDGGTRPLHHRLATHWARLVEQLHAAERMYELASAPELTSGEVRAAVPARPVIGEAAASIEAPRGTLIHHYRTDADGLVTGVNLIVATTANHGAIALAVTAAARAVLEPGREVSERALSTLEMAVRAYDPCLACATHTHPGGGGWRVVLRDRAGAPIAIVRRRDGRVVLEPATASGCRSS